MDGETGVCDDADDFFSISVEFKVTLSPRDCNSVANPTKKTFQINGYEYPMSRFGSWVFHSLKESESRNNLLKTGGLAVVLTWAVFEAYDSLITVWVNNPDDNRFVFDVKKVEQKRILDEISDGKLGRELEIILKKLTIPSYCEYISIKLIKIVQETDTAHRISGKAQTSANVDTFDHQRVDRLQQAEVIAQHMKSKQYSWAIPILKQCLTAEKDEGCRLQLLIRLYLCVANSKNEKDMEQCLPRLIVSMKSASIPPTDIALYMDDFKDLFDLLRSNGSTVKALEIGFAFQNIVSKIPDATEKLSTNATNIQHLCEAIKSLLKINPTVCLKSEARSYIKRVQDEISRMKNENYCDTLVQAQCVYYSEFALKEVKECMDRRISDIFSNASVEFTRLSSCWADFAFVITRLRRHPQISTYLADEDYVRTLRKISMKPTLLEKYIKEPKIAEAHEVLVSEFGLLESIPQENGNKEATSQTPGDNDSNDVNEPVDKKSASEAEKEKGNEAYKKLDFATAHLHYDQAIGYDPGNAMLHYNKAAVFISQKNYQMAKIACVVAKDMIEKDSIRFGQKDAAKVIARLARAEFLDGNREVASALYQKSLSISRDPKVFEQMQECQRSIFGMM